MVIFADVREAARWSERSSGFGERVRIGDDHRAQLRVGREGVVARLRHCSTSGRARCCPRTASRATAWLLERALS